MYWSFLSTCTLLCIIEISWAHDHHFTILNLFKNMYLTFDSIFSSTCTSFQWIEGFWLHILYFVHWTILNTFSSFHFIEDFLVHVIYFTISKLFEYIYFTSKYKSLFSTCMLLQFAMLMLFENNILHYIQSA